MAEPPAPVLHRAWASRDGWRGTRAGLWAWLLQRAAAVALVVVIALHLRNPFARPVQATLLALVLLHGLLGLRAILLDLGLPVRLHRALFAGALLLGVALFALVWWWRFY
ncbi:MAG: succinate dehydrogenase [Candidatus Rokubacteria bacterium]|nr:succinate dehydrogenase [Candidatus Rokubacteria bacterium]